MPLTFDRRISIAYPSGLQNLHANVHADANGFYMCSNGIIHAYTPDATRVTSEDITLENLPTTQTVWGFTGLSDGRWAVVTRETFSQSNRVGTLRTFTSEGNAEHVKEIPAVLQGFLSERFGNPKAVVESGDKMYVRVARPGVTGRLRFLRFDMDGDYENADLTFPNVNPTALSDAGADRGFIIAIQHVQRIAYGVVASDFADAPDLETTLDTRNTLPYGAAAFGGRLYAFDRGGFIYVYGGIPDPSAPTGAGTQQGGFGLSVISMFLTNERLRDDFGRIV